MTAAEEGAQGRTAEEGEAARANEKPDSPGALIFRRLCGNVKIIFYLCRN